MTTLKLAALALCVALFMWRFPKRMNTTHGSARWCTVWSAFRRGLFRKKGIRVGSWTGRLSVHHEPTHAITFGAAGAGKGVSAIIPNLLGLRRAFLVDPGGENTAIAARSFAARGIEFGCINPFGMFADEPHALPRHGFNPFNALDPAHQDFVAHALVFAEMLTPRSGKESGSSAYFKDAGEGALHAVIIHQKTNWPKPRQTLGALYEAFHGDAASWRVLLKEMKANAAFGGLVAQGANKLERISEQAPEEFSAILSTVQQDLRWLSDPLVRAMMSRDDVDFSILKEAKHGGVISVVLPLEYMESHAAITRLALACAVLEMERMPVARAQVVFLIDEAAALGKVLRLPNWHATMRKYKCAFWTIWQSMGQLRQLYDHNAQTIIGNCNLKQFLSFGDIDTAKYGESLLGRTTVQTESFNAKGEKSRGETGRPLMMADELLRLKSGKQIVLIENLDPLFINKTPYWSQPDLGGLYGPNPYFGGKGVLAAAQPTLADRVAALYGKAYYALVWLLAPHKLAAIALWIPLALHLVDPAVLAPQEPSVRGACRYVGMRGIETYRHHGECPWILTRWGNL